MRNIMVKDFSREVFVGGQYSPKHQGTTSTPNKRPRPCSYLLLGAFTISALAMSKRLVAHINSYCFVGPELGRLFLGQCSPIKPV